MTKLTPEQRLEKAQKILFDTDSSFVDAYGAANAFLTIVCEMNADEIKAKGLGYLANQLCNYTAYHEEIHDRLWAVLKGEPLPCDANEIAAQCGDEPEEDSR